VDLDHEMVSQELTSTQGQEPSTTLIAPSRSRSLLLARPGDEGDGDEGDGSGDGDGDGGEGDGSGDEGGQEQPTFDAAYVKKLRAEAAAHRKEAAEAKAKLKQREDAELSELEKAQKERDEAKATADTANAKVRDALLKATATAEAVKLNIIDPELALLAIRDKVTFSDDGEPENVTDVLAQLVKDKPHLVGEKSTPGAGGTGTNPAGGKGASITAESLRSMSQAQVADLMATDPEGVRKALSGG
jgi:hypothetical protein